jgi:PEP-CTERM motif
MRTRAPILLLIVTLIVSGALLAGPLSAQANLIWDWTGDCQRVLFGDVPLCTHAALHVVTTDAYIPGEEVGFPGACCVGHWTPLLLEALYSDENVTYDFTFIANYEGGNLLLPASPSDRGYIFLIPAEFLSDASGVWRFEGEGALHPPICGELHNPFCGYGVVGVHGVWTRVPAPSTLVLLGVGVVGLGFLRRRQDLARLPG